MAVIAAIQRQEEQERLQKEREALSDEALARELSEAYKDVSLYWLIWHKCPYNHDSNVEMHYM